MDCEFCKKVLSTKENLIYHQKNNKYCLLIQQKKGDNQIHVDIRPSPEQLDIFAKLCLRYKF